MLQRTGDYLARSNFLPKTFIQLKQVTDANKEKPGKVVILVIGLCVRVIGAVKCS